MGVFWEVYYLVYVFPATVDVFKKFGSGSDVTLSKETVSAV